jgi:hypothetical protein
MGRQAVHFVEALFYKPEGCRFKFFEFFTNLILPAA